MEEVVLLDDSGLAIGSAPKDRIHTRETPLHLAFSCYVLDRAGRLLLSRRAVTKQTWPGVWSNSFCGHPAPCEALEAAVQRRAETELGFDVTGTEMALPDFRYRAVDHSGVVENELCPVLIAATSCEVTPNPDEVGQVAWVELENFESALSLVPFAFSPWSTMQFPKIADRLRVRRRSLLESSESPPS